MKKPMIILLTLCMLFGFSLGVSAVQINLTGTWVGPTHVEGPGIDLEMTLVLEHKGDTITGKFNDDMGFVDCEITDAKLEGNVFTFKAVANTPDGDVAMKTTVTVNGDTMEGKWEGEDGTYGEWTAKRQKD